VDALVLFKGDMGAYVRLYTFLSQIFDYGNTAIEKRAIFYKRLLPLLEFGRERERHRPVEGEAHPPHAANRASLMPLGDGEKPKLEPITEAGSGSVQEKEKAHLAEIIEKVNTLFEGELTDDDKLVYVNNVIKGKLLESRRWCSRRRTTRRSSSPTHPTYRPSPKAMAALKDILLNHASLWEDLRARAGADASGIV
jgi:type I restriction enzyme R subunit